MNVTLIPTILDISLRSQIFDNHFLPRFSQRYNQQNLITLRDGQSLSQGVLLYRTDNNATSAKLTGQESAHKAEEVRENLSGKIDLILDGGISPGGVASTVLDCTKTEPLILRTGPISWQKIIKVIAE